MFRFQGKSQQLKVERLVRRLIDQSSPNKHPLEGSQRIGDRYNRAVPALLCPWEDGAAVAAETAIGITKDISDHGMSLVLPQPFRGGPVVVGFAPIDEDDDAWFLGGTIHQNVQIGGGFWQIGIEFDRILEDRVECLQPIAAQLAPPPRPVAVS